MREYTISERGYVGWLNDDINDRIDRELDISRYWDQDEDFGWIGADRSLEDR